MAYDLRFIKAVKEFEAAPDFEDREVIWIYGDSGSGKSRKALEIAEAHGSYYFKDTSKWWDGYYNQETVILDDWRPSEYFKADTWDAMFLLTHH